LRVVVSVALDRPAVSISAGVVRGTGERNFRFAIPTAAPVPEEMPEMFTIEEDRGTYTGSVRRHHGYYAGDFTCKPMCTASELSALAKLRPPPSRRSIPGLGSVHTTPQTSHSTRAPGSSSSS
jgi:hypothetical protein